MPASGLFPSHLFRKSIYNVSFLHHAQLIAGHHLNVTQMVFQQIDFLLILPVLLYDILIRLLDGCQLLAHPVIIQQPPVSEGDENRHKHYEYEKIPTYPHNIQIETGISLRNLDRKYKANLNALQHKIKLRIK